MTRWYRAYVGTCSDPKIGAIAHASGTSKCKVIAMWHFILELAADARNGGKVRMDASLFCGTLDLTIEEVRAIWAQMIDRQMVTDDEVVSWKKRQYETDVTDPTNAERQRKWKSKRLGNGGVTEQKRPDTDTDTEKIIPLARKKKPAVSLPDGWVPSVVSTQKAQKLGLTPAEIGREADRFRNHARQNDRRCVLWDAAFDNWCIGAAERAGKTPPTTPNPQAFSAMPGSPEFEAWRTHLRDGGKSSLIRELDRRQLEGRPFAFDSRWPPGHKISPEATA